MASEWFEMTDEELVDLTDAELVGFDRRVRSDENELRQGLAPERLLELISWIQPSLRLWEVEAPVPTIPSPEATLKAFSPEPPTEREIQIARSFAMSGRLEVEKARRVLLMLQTARLALGMTHQEIADAAGIEPELVAEIEQGRAWSPRPDLFEQTCSIHGIKEAQHLSRTPWKPLADIRFCRTIREVTIDPAWLSEGNGVANLARLLRESREFGRLPELGQALEAAGCDDREILDHCRNPGLHGRGCWVVDGLVRAGRTT